MPNRKRKDRDNQGWQKKILRMEQTEHDKSRKKKDGGLPWEILPGERRWVEAGRTQT